MAWSAALSLAFHASAFVLMQGATFAPVQPPPEAVEVALVEDIEAVEVEEQPLGAEEELPVAEPEPAPPSRPTPAQPSRQAPAPTEEAPAPAEEAPVVFDNVTLSNEGESSWAAPQSSGVESGARARNSNVGSAPGQARGRATAGSGGGTGGDGVAVVPLSNLSRAPRDPDLSSLLERNYPEVARSRGIEGVARVRIRVNPDGSLSQLRVLSETVPGVGFGEACLRTLRGSQWTPPLDAGGKPVATLVRYTCDFRVRY